MIEKLTIENFKCFAEKTEIDLAPITLLYGENSGGKSTVLQALDLLKEIHVNGIESGLTKIPYRDFVSGKDLSRQIAIGFYSDYGHFPDLIVACGGDVTNKKVASFLTWETRLSWNTENQKPQIEKLCAEEQFAKHKVVRTETGVAMGYKVSQTYYAQSEMADLCRYLSEKSAVIRDGVDRLVEQIVMRDFLKDHPKAYDETVKCLIELRASASDAIFSGLEPEPPLIHVTEGDTQYGSRAKLTEIEEEQRKLYPNQYDEGYVEQMFQSHLEHYEEEEKRLQGAKQEGEKFMQQQREGLPEWIKMCPVGWAEYRNSSDFKKKAEAIKQEKYAQLLEFCDKPASSFFDTFRFRLDFSYADMLHAEVEKSSFIDDLLAVIDSRYLELVYTPETERLENVDVRFSSDSDSVFQEIYVKQLKNLSIRFQWKLDQEAKRWKNCYTSMAKLLRASVLISPHREIPKRIYSFQELNDSLPFQLAENKNDLCKRVSKWLEKLGVDYEVSINRWEGENNFKILLQDTRNPELPPINYADVGFGVSQILPVLVAGLSDTPSIILVDEPEQHIHPCLQAELGTFFAESMKERGHQFIIATHSEYLLLRLQSLIRREKESLESKDVNVLYVSRGHDELSVRTLALNEFGEFLEGWPEGFMPDRLKELA